MTNPLYSDDPDFYEKPGETVHLITDVNPTRVTVPALPWKGEEETPSREAHLAALFGERRHYSPGGRCSVCSKVTTTMHWGASVILCDYCSRAQARDETAKARAKQPNLSSPRIHVREGWERWAGEQPRESHDGPQIRDHETRIG